VLNTSENPFYWVYAMTKDTDEEWNNFSLKELELILKDNLSGQYDGDLDCRYIA
jgi:hypothetical protein